MRERQGIRRYQTTIIINSKHKQQYLASRECHGEQETGELAIGSYPDEGQEVGQLPVSS